MAGRAGSNQDRELFSPAKILSKLHFLLCLDVFHFCANLKISLGRFQFKEITNPSYFKSIIYSKMTFQNCKFQANKYSRQF